MKMDREFTIFADDIDWRKRKRLRLLEADDFIKARFTKLD